MDTLLHQAKQTMTNTKDKIGIITRYESLYKGALYIMDLLKTEERVIQEREAGQTPEERRQYIYLDHAKLSVLSLSVEIFCLMSIEALLNAYGVECLGEEFYKRNLERLRITQKLETLLAIRRNKFIDDDAEILKIARKLFERRNQIVHPKASEIKRGKIPKLPKHDPIKKAEESLADTKRFLELFAEDEGDQFLKSKIHELIVDTEHFDVVLMQLT